MSDRIDPRTAVDELIATRYHGAAAIFLTGSTARIAPTGGELFATSAHSDLDLTAVVEATPAPYREAFVYKGWPVEALVADAAGLEKIFARAPALGECSVPSHVLDAIVFPSLSPVSAALQRRARRVIDAGPAPLTEREHRFSRFVVSRLVHELESPRPAEDVLAVGSFLHARLVDYHLRAANRWSGKAAFLSRRLRDEDPALARRIAAAFRALFADHEPAAAIALADELLAPYGGRLTAFRAGAS